MAKTVTIQSGEIFPTIASAQKYFSDVREATPLGGLLSDPARSDVLDVYRRYCEATNYQAVDAVDVTTELDKRNRPGGTFSTKAFAVVTASGSIVIFSMDKALAAIAV